MTVSELTPNELYAIIVFANVTTAVIFLGTKQLWNDLELKRQKALLMVGIFAVIGLPVLTALPLVSPEATSGWWPF